MNQDTIQTRFNELLESAKSPTRRSSDSVESGWYSRWAASSQNLIGLVFGKQSDHYEHITSAIKKFDGYDSTFRITLGVLLSADEEWRKGFYGDIDTKISGEIFGDFIKLAKEALSQGNKDVAAVLACAALEDALKRYARKNGLDIEGKTMDSVVGALKGAGLVAGAQKSLLDVMPRIRNFAMHADFAKITDADVGSVLGFTEQFLLTKF
jgi:hypothetical protein